MENKLPEKIGILEASLETERRTINSLINNIAELAEKVEELEHRVRIVDDPDYLDSLPESLSKCCGSSVRFEGDSFGEGTMHYECIKCGKPCDVKDDAKNIDMALAMAGISTPESERAKQMVMTMAQEYASQSKEDWEEEFDEKIKDLLYGKSLYSPLDLKNEIRHWISQAVEQARLKWEGIQAIKDAFNKSQKFADDVPLNLNDIIAKVKKEVARPFTKEELNLMIWILKQRTEFPRLVNGEEIDLKVKIESMLREFEDKQS